MVGSAGVGYESPQGQERFLMSECPYCSNDLTKVYHTGMCPKVKSIEYYPNGKTKKIEFNENQFDLPLWPIPEDKEYKYTIRWLTS